MAVEVHHTAIVDQGASVGEGTKIWHFSHICGGAFVGERCSLGQNVYVGGRARIGNRVKIQNNVSVYDSVTLDDDVFCGPSVVFTNVHNPRSAVNRKHEYRNTYVSRGATLGANSTIVCGVTVGEYAFVGAGAVVTRNVLPFALVMGVPAVQVGWIDRHGNKLDLPLFGDGVVHRENSGELYRLVSGSLEVSSFEP